MLNIKSFLENVTHHPGVYQMLGSEGQILYVGKARDLKKRLSSYFKTTQTLPRTIALLKNTVDITITVTRTENEALLLEWNLIRKHKPRYNVIFRDDKSYPYIYITQEQGHPRIGFYRGMRKKKGLYFGPFPNVSTVRETIRITQKLFGLRTCSDSYFNYRTRACLLNQIGLCSGVCVDLINSSNYQQDVQHAVLFLEGKSQKIITDLQIQMEQAAKELNYERASRFRDQIAKLRSIQQRQFVNLAEGHADIIGFAQSSGITCMQILTMREGSIIGSCSYFPTVPLTAAPEEIMSAFIGQHYLNKFNVGFTMPTEILVAFKVMDDTWLSNALSEQAKAKVVICSPKRGERKKWLEMAELSAKESLASQLISKTNTVERFEAIQQVLHLDKRPDKIECFDISHMMGEASVASCVVFNAEGPIKSLYRRYNIEGITPGDDIAAMQQALTRRFKNAALDKASLPDILLIDGGKPQLNSAYAILQNYSCANILIVGIAKGASRKPGLETLYRIHEAPLSLQADSIALHGIQHIRDEAHRFAITGHRKSRDRKRTVSSLESIVGIGVLRRRTLLRHFGGIQAINRASLDELAQVPGISQSLAKRIFEALHDIAE